MDLATVRPATFEPYVGTDFEVTASGGDRISLRLAGVDPLRTAPHEQRREPFSLVFVGPSDPRLEQRIHALEHAELGLIEIFLVPVGADPSGGQRYEAVFN